MTNKAIEEFATMAVKRSILLTGLLDQHIAENDKEPFWDGNIYIYNSARKTKADFVGRVPVQVKGKCSKDFTADSINLPVKITDLRGYIKDQGIIYFVVLISDDGSQSKIYYNSLAPVKIKHLLSSTKNSKTISVEFQTFSDDNCEKINILLDLHAHNHRQISHINSNLPTIEDLLNSSAQLELVQPISAYRHTNSDADFMSSILGRETYMYANIDGVSIPLADPMILTAIGRQINQTIKVNDKIYYTSFTRIHKKSHTSIKIGETTEILINQNEHKLTLNITAPPQLSDRIRDLEFLIDAFESQHFVINDVRLDLAIANLSPNASELAQHNIHYKYCCKVKRLLEILNIDDDLDLSILTEKEDLHLRYLINAFVDGKTVNLAKANDSKYLYFKIQDLKILVFALEETPNSFEYRYLNLFDGKYSISPTEMVDGKQVFYPQTSVLTAEHYVNISNINYSTILSQYKHFAQDNPNTIQQANLDTLQMMLAYDICSNQILLDTAIEILQWITKSTMPNDPDLNIYRINYLQAIARTRVLNEEETKLLINISLDNKCDDDINFAANVLLKQKPYAAAYLEKLDDNLKAHIKEFPIYNLYCRL